MIDPRTLRGTWNYPTQIRFGPGRIAELPKACEEVGIRSPLLVSDPTLSRLPMVAAAQAACKAAGLKIGLFSDVKPNPVGRNVEDGLRAFRAGGHDGIIAFGGGSALDTAKVIAFMAGQTRPMWDFEDVGDNWTRANAAGIAPTIAIPTTAGTGSEVGRAGVILDEATHTKKIIFHPGMMPAVVIADPELTIGLPAPITAATGMDALAHCLEAYCAPFHHPYADGIAIEGIRLAALFLPRAYRDGKDLEARAQMLAAAGMGATAFQKGLGAIHALSHPVGAILDSHHGLTNAVFMPYVLAFNRPAIEDKMARLARYLGLADASFGAIMSWVLGLRQAIGIPHALDALGVKPEHLDRLSAMAEIDPCAGGNPVPVKAAELRSIYAAALEGRVG